MLNRVEIKNFTVFSELNIGFSEGVNVLIGENGTGKTHVMKLLYAACKAARFKKTGIDFPTKLIRSFQPDEHAISRLVRKEKGVASAEIRIETDKGNQIMLGLSARKKEVILNNHDDWDDEIGKKECTFIPAKEILSHSKNLIAAIESGNVEFDDTYKDIITAASVDLNRNGIAEADYEKYLDRLYSVTNGRVEVSDEEFYLISKSKTKLEFQLVSEGIRKLALLWQLIKNGVLRKGSILFWDEPEANINPVNIPLIVNLLLDLAAEGIQVFVATHDYFLAKYIELRKREVSPVKYLSFYKDGDMLLCEEADTFTSLDKNSIISEQYRMYYEEVGQI